MTFSQLPPFREWKIQFKIAWIGTAIGAIILIANGIQSVPAIEPFFPATRGYVRDVASDTADALRGTRVGVLDLKLVALDGQLTALEIQLRMVETRIAQDPNDGLLKALKSKLDTDIKSLNSQIRVTACEKARAEYGPSYACSTFLPGGN